MKRKTVLKRTLACCLAVILMLTGVPLASFSGIDPANFKNFFGFKASAATWENLTYEVSDGEATITGCDNSISGDIVIPDTIDGYPVTSIGDYTFRDCKGLTSITIPDSVTSIGDYTFRGCTGLTSVTIPDSVTSIGDWAFSFCTGLTSITIPDSVTRIGTMAFDSCTGLTSVTIPNSVTIIGGGAFYDTAYYNNNSNWEDGVLYIGSNLIEAKNSISGAYDVKDGTKTIADHAFYGSTGLTSITIPDSVTSIGGYAFEHCTGLTSVTIPDSVTSIGYLAFSDCTDLTKITVSSGNTVYHSTDNCLIRTKTKTLICGFKNSIIPSDGSVTSIGGYAFSSCTGLTSVTIPDSVTSISAGAFYDCTGLTSIKIPNSVTSIGESAFRGCTGLTKITVSSGNTVYHSTDNCLIETKTKTLISGCKSSIIPTDGSVTSIGKSAFSECRGLTSITIPDSVTSIGDWAFDGCTGLTSITIPDSVTSIGGYAFYSCTGLTSITIPDGMTSIGGGAFENCTGLTNVTIPDSVTGIGSSAFSGCTGLTDVYYTGSEADWKKISIGDYNSPLTSATRHYNQTGSSVDNKVYNDVLVKNFEIEKTSGKTNLSFNPSWFTLDSLNYNHNLARLTSQFAMLGYAKKADLEKALKAIGFIWDENFVDLNTGSKKPGENDTEESKKRVNYFIAHKKMTVNGEETTLVFMGLIGSSHNQWYSNFDPGTGVVHKGFNNAKNFITNSSKTGRLDEYFKKYLQGEKNVKILITGHSRGAATSNLVAAELIDTGRYTSPENIYTYAYATPNSTSNPDRGASRYNRIFNFVNPEDFVTKCMPSKWHYGRYGITYTLPSKTNESSKSYKQYYNNMNSRFKDYFGKKSYQPYKDGEKPVYEVVKKLTTTVGTVKEMYSKKMSSGTGKKNTAEFFRDALCPFVAKNGKDEENAATINMLAAWFSPTTSKTFDTIADFFLKYEGATSVKKMLDDNGISINFATVSAPALVVALSLVLPMEILPATAIASPWVIYKAEQLLLWARNGQNNFSHAHMAQTYAAFVDSMTEEQIKKTRKSYLNTVNCPVDIEVYEKSTGELVGKITNNVIDETVAAKENAIVMGVDGDSKSFWLPSNEDYEVKLIGNDEGTMDYTVANVDPDLGETERVNFFDVEITDGLTMTGEMKTDTALEDYSLEYDNGNKLTPAETLSGDEITSYNINVSVEGNGYATESMTALSGDYVTVNAMETVGNSTDGWYIFDGWYEDEEKVSSERSFSFVAKGNRSLIAKFVWSDVCLHPMQEELIEIPATCTESGNEPGVFCMMCETYLSGGKEIPALGHDIVTDIEAVKPTCTENGKTQGVHCTRCDYKVEAVELKPLGHVDDDNDRVCERCGKEAAIEGACGEDAFYKYYLDGELIISGTGAVTGFDGFRYSKDVLKVTVLDGITSLGYECFAEFCNMEEVIIGADLLEIKENAFSTGAFSRKLRNIEVSANNPVFHSDGNCLIKTETKELVLGCNNSVIPTDGSVTAITMGAFWGCDEIKELFIPKSVIRIDEMPIVCINSNLSSIVVEEGNPVYQSNGNCLINIETGALVLGCNNSVIPTDGSVKSICSGAFVGYNDLTELVIPASVTNIDLQAVYACGGIRKLLVEEGNSVYHSSGNCIIDTANKKLVLGCCSSDIPDDGSVEIIESASFAFIDSLNWIKIPEGVKSIMSEAFIGCNNMNTIVLPKSITSINDCYLGYIFDFNTGMTYLNDSFTIVGYAGSFAEQYASYRGMHFVDLATHTHEYGQYTVKFEPTCTDDGMEERTCSVCGDKQTITVAALGHKKALLPAVSATCTETGLTEGNKCSVCGEIFVKQEEIPALGHDLVIDVEAKEATCTQSGTTEGVHCTRCDYKVEAVELKPLGHSDEDNDGNCDRCGERIGNPTPSDPSQNCSCACHKKGIANFFFKIILFFQKIFKKNRVCNCGVWHY